MGYEFPLFFAESERMIVFIWDLRVKLGGCKKDLNDRRIDYDGGRKNADYML